MAIIRMYTGPDGKTHLKDAPELMLAQPTPDAKALTKAQGVIFRRTDKITMPGYHNAPRRQFIVVLSGDMEIETGAGEKRRLVPGDVLLAEDLTGQGHVTRGSGDRAIIPLT
ncbi:MAG: hypothetical protein HY261_08255 [Chloroflexi bacterium]|nr:hypothetical protein [Chloroflexota bacterium]